MYAFAYGLLVGFAPAMLFAGLWSSARTKLRQLKETTEDIRAWDAGYLAEDEPTTGRHALRVPDPFEPEPQEQPAAPPVVVSGAKRTALWYDLITQWAEAHDPAVPAPPKIAPVMPVAYTDYDTQSIPVVGVNVTRAPQIEEMIPSRPKREPLPNTTWPIWGPEPTAGPGLRSHLMVGVRLGLIEFENSGARINAWLMNVVEQILSDLFPPAPPKVEHRPKRTYAFAASTTRWEYRGGAR